jgi:hypothetical protein
MGKSSELCQAGVDRLFQYLAAASRGVADGEARNGFSASFDAYLNLERVRSTCHLLAMMCILRLVLNGLRDARDRWFEARRTTIGSFGLSAFVVNKLGSRDILNPNTDRLKNGWARTLLHLLAA